jgi:hypothetical protein
MGGGHHLHVHGNEKNMNESDEEMGTKIQLVETIKHSPNHFHREFFSIPNMFAISGGFNTLMFTAIGAVSFGTYYSNLASTMRTNYYSHHFRTILRWKVGAVVGFIVGYNRFGDRQVMHNAYVAERLRRRYPESMELTHQPNELWKLKNVFAPHDFYQWR